MEFLKFKVGDKVRVKSLDWYNNQSKDKCGSIGIDCAFVEDMAQYCGKILKITELFIDGYGVDSNPYGWQDWMLEDEVITEEKKELLKKNNMETKKMTLKEAQEYVKDTKYIVWSEDESRKLQKKLFEIGCGWIAGGYNVIHTEGPFLYVSNNLLITFSAKDKYKYFDDSCNFIKSAADVISIEIESEEESKTKFNPKTLQDFDKVLVREDDTNKWRLSFFDTYEPGCFYCIDYCFRQCVPYNEETKHLKGTTDDAPEYYKTW